MPKSLLCFLFIVGLSPSLKAQTPSGSGTVRFFDRGYETNDILFCDSLHLSMTNVSGPDAGTAYHAWLIHDSGTYHNLGELTVNAGSVSFGFAESSQNLVQNHRAFAISQEVSGFSGSQPTQGAERFTGMLYDGSGSPGSGNALTYIRNVVGSFQTPSSLGLMSQMVRQLFKSDNLIQHATLATVQTTASNVKVHTNHSYDFVTGTPDPRVTSGSVANNGDPLGYGLRRYADFDTTYTSPGGAGYHIQLALDQPDASQSMMSAGQATLATLQQTFGADNASGIAKQFTDKCLEIIGKTYTTVGPALTDAVIMKNMAQTMQDSIFVAYRHALDMATMPINAVTLPPAHGPVFFFPDEAMNIGPTDPVSWYPVEGATSYRLVIVDSTESPPEQVMDEVTADTILTMGPLAFGHRFSVTVTPRNSAGSGPDSTRAFWTLLETAVLVSPDSLAQNISLTPTLRWRGIPYATSYSLRVWIYNSGPGTVTPVLVTTTSDTSRSLDTLEYGRTYQWAVNGIYEGGVGLPTQWRFSTATLTSAENPDLPMSFSMDPNYPNPFNPSTAIRFQIPDSRVVQLTVYDQIGRNVRTLLDGPLPPGLHTVRWNAEGLSSGTYLIRLEAMNEAGEVFRAIQKGVLLK